MYSYSVSEFVVFLNSALDQAVFPDGVAVEGEVAEYRVSQGKWVWFLLKDNDSVLSCFGTTWKLRQPVEDGLRVRIYGQPKVHQKSGRFSIVVERLEPVGEGALKRAYELLKKSLEVEGLFDISRKRSLPKFPARIGLIASCESAAYSDFLRILRNRWAGVEVNSHHVQVQGGEAVGNIVSAFNFFAEHQELADVLVLTRGGGSLEDLQAFNSEAVVRAIFSSKIPVVVGVGHERDETLADLVADRRASTPSNAAELVVPDRVELLSTLDLFKRRLVDTMEMAVTRQTTVLERSVNVMERSVTGIASFFRQRQNILETTLLHFSEQVEYRSKEIERLKQVLSDTIDVYLERITNNVSVDIRLLNNLNPRSVLRRGYAIVRQSGKPVSSAKDLQSGSLLDIELHHGNLKTKVLEILKGGDK